MESKIIFQGCNINYIYFLFFIISSVTMTLIDRFLFADEIKEKIPDKFTYYTNKEMLDIFLINLADLIAIIPYCIRKRSLRKNNDNKKEEKNIDNESNENKKKVELIYNESKQSATKINQKTIIFYLILIAACDYLKKFIFFLYYLIFPGEEYDTYPFNFTVIFDIILQFVFSYLILKVHFYRLQHFSLYLNVVILIIIFALDLVEILGYKPKFKGNIFIFIPIDLIFFCLEYVIGKKVILDGYVSLYIIIIMKGVIKLIFNIILSVIVLIVNKTIITTFEEYFKEPKYILLMLGLIIAYFFYDLFVWIIVDKFSPNYTPLIIIVEEICNFIFDLIYDNKFSDLGDHKYIRIVLYAISLFGVILHNEIVIINICGLGTDTKYFSNERAKTEVEYSTSDDPNILKRFESFEINDIGDEEPQTN